MRVLHTLTCPAAPTKEQALKLAEHASGLVPVEDTFAN